MLDFLGTTENFPAISNIPWTIPWLFRDNTTGEDANLDGTTFEGRVYIGKEQTPIEFDIRKSEDPEQPGSVIISCPGLPAGRWPYEIYARDDNGDRERMVYGHIGVIASVEEVAEELGTYSSRTLLVRLPGDTTKRLRLQWLSSTLAAYSAQQTYDYYKKTKDEADRMQEAVEKVEAVQGKLDELDDAVQDAKDAAEAANRVHHIGANNNWWLGDEDTGKRAVGIDGRDGRDGCDGEDGLDGEKGDPGRDGANGKDGHSPIIQYIDETIDGVRYEGNYWFEWRDNPASGEPGYYCTYTRAEARDGAPGQDGIDGDAVQQLYLNSAADLPNPGSSSIVCHVPVEGKPGEFTIYKWLTMPGGTSEWKAVNTTTVDLSHYALKDLSNCTAAADEYETNYPDTHVPRISWIKKALQVAATNILARIVNATYYAFGLVRLSRPETVGCGNIGLTEDGSIGTLWATTTEGGSSKLSTNTTIATGGFIGMNDQKQLMAQLAGYRTYGVVCFGTASRITLNNAPHVITIAMCDGQTTYNQWAGNMENSMNINLAQNGCLRYDANGANGENTGNSLYVSYDSTLAITDDGKLSAKNWVTNTWSLSDGKPVNAAAVNAKLAEYLTIESFKEQMASYVTKNFLTQTLTAYITTSTLNLKLLNYVTTSALTTTLSGYVTNAQLQAKDYMTKREHNNDMANYVQSAGGVKKLALMSEEEYAALAAKASDTLYLLF